MRHAFVFATLSLLPLLAVPTEAATHHVQVRDNVFEPSHLAIAVGDVVTWTNAGGHHNVVAEDRSFDSGPPTHEFVYSHTFDSPGSYPTSPSPTRAPAGGRSTSTPSAGPRRRSRTSGPSQPARERTAPTAA